ncbi:MAG: peptidoglycan-associated lipoprotein Pal [Gemmatimonadota bacterium]
MSSRALSLLFAVSVIAACGGKAAPEQPAPSGTTNSDAATRARQDSIDAANRARAEADARDRADRDRMAREAADRGAHDRGSVLEQLATMIHFDYDKADVQEADNQVLDLKAGILSANPAVRLRVSGHADERGSDEYNLAIGNRRAAAAKRYLVNKGVDAARIEVISYGEERPLDPGHDEAAYTKNRRAEFEVIAGGDNLVAPR